MKPEEIEKLIPKLIKRGETDIEALGDAFQLCRDIELLTINCEDGSMKLRERYYFNKAHNFAREIRTMSARAAKSGAGVKAVELNSKTLLFDAPYDFDAYCRFLEWNRPLEKKFYEPRRFQLRKVADGLQSLEDDKLDLLTISLPPGVGKTTIAIFYLTWIGGKHAEKPIITGSHNAAFLRGVYDELLRIMDPEGEYLWKTVFPDVQVIKTNAKDMNIDLGKSVKNAKRFPTFQNSSIGSGNAGKIRAEQLLYCDDLVEGIEQALSKERMDKLWDQYVTDLRQRKIGKCKELHIATRWSIHDPIGRLQRAYEDNPRVASIVIPAMDENDESNFNYANSVGFTTQFYRDQRDIMPDTEWRALYMNEPIEREGQLYNENELRRYFTLPDREPDAILAACDTKTVGADYFACVIAYQYGNDFYIEDCLVENYGLEIIQTNVGILFLHHGVQLAQFESNAAGGKIAEEVQAYIKERGGKTKITTRYTTQNKDTKIIVNAPWVKEHCLFKDQSTIKGGSFKEYRAMLNMLCGYTMYGKNKHDDVPDVFAQLALFVDSFAMNVATVVKRPF